MSTNPAIPAAAPVRHVLITGGNCGLGLETARAALEQYPDTHVVITVRSQERFDEAVAALGTIGQSLDTRGAARLSFAVLELGSLASVRGFKKRLADQGVSKLDALVCNAGVQVVSGLQQTEDGLETTFAVNHLGHFLLIHELLPLLAPSSRVVLVSSGTHDPALKINIPPPIWADPRTFAFPPPWSDPMTDGQRAYSTSKLCNILCAFELDRRLRARSRPVSVLAFDPGMMPGSGLARGYPGVLRFFWNNVLPIIRVLNPFTKWRSLARSGADLAALSLADAYRGVSGKYYSGLVETASSVDSLDESKAQRLWELSVELAKPETAI